VQPFHARATGERNQLRGRLPCQTVACNDEVVVFAVASPQAWGHIAHLDKLPASYVRRRKPKVIARDHTSACKLTFIWKKLMAHWTEQEPFAHCEIEHNSCLKRPNSNEI
jgi:hypothetical protein